MAIDNYTRERWEAQDLILRRKDRENLGVLSGREAISREANGRSTSFAALDSRSDKASRVSWLHGEGPFYLLRTITGVLTVLLQITILLVVLFK